MANDDSPNNGSPDSGESKITATSKDKSSLVEMMRILVPAISAVAVAYFSYLQLTQPKMLEISATQTAVAASIAAPATQASTPQATVTEIPTSAPVAAISATVPAIAKATVTEAVATLIATETSAPTATTAASNAASPTSEATTEPTPAPTSVPTTVAAAAPTPVSPPASAAATDSEMVLIATREGGDPVALLPDTLRFQGDTGIELRSGEWVPFTNIMAIAVGEARLGIVPIDLTFTDGTTQSSSVDKDASLIQGETAHGAVQIHMDQIEAITLPNQAQTPAQLPEEMVMLVSKVEENAQIIPSTLRFQGGTYLLLRSGEYIPLANIMVIAVGEARLGAVPIDLTFTDGTTQSGSVDKDASLIQGETAHGAAQIHMDQIEAITLANEAQSAQPSADALVTLTTPTGDTAQVMASTLRFQDEDSLSLASGESIPFSDLRTLVVGTTSGGSVPVELTFADGTTQSATLVKDSDVLQGETLHGNYLRNVHQLKQVDFLGSD